MNSSQSTSAVKNFFSNKGVKLTIRLIVLGFIGLVMLIPLFMVNGVVEERNKYRDEATSTITNSWGGNQVLTPIVLTVPFIQEDRDSKGKIYTVMKYRHFLPEHLNVQSDVDTETRYKGIFKKAVFESKINIKGSYETLNFTNSEKVKDVLWNEAFVSVGINDLKTIQGQPEITFAGKVHSFEPGLKNEEIMNNGISSDVNLSGLNTQKNDFEIKLSLRGADSIRYVPVGKHTKLTIKSKWKDPSFIGEFLPVKKEINDEGFNATWDISQLARGHKQQWTGKVNWIKESMNQSNNSDNYYRPSYKTVPNLQEGVSPGVSLLIAVDFYRNCLRAVKYGVLFIALTFITYFMFEVVSRMKIHPFQYLLVGVAVCVFYLLLLSMSEFIGFVWAYLLASLSNIGLITMYTKAITKQEKPTLYLSMLGVLVFLYSFLYILLQLQDMSLLFGSVGLFAVLAVIMFATRNIDWYGQKE